MEVDGQFFEARADAAVLLQPADTLLDHRAAAIGFAVKGDARIPPRQFVVLVRDHRLDLLPLNPVAHAGDAIPLVTGELFRLVPAFSPSPPPSDEAGDGLADHRFGASAFVHLAGAHLDRERSARAVSNQMELRSKPASAAAQRVVRRLARVSR